MEIQLDSNNCLALRNKFHSNIEDRKQGCCRSPSIFGLRRCWPFQAGCKSDSKATTGQFWSAASSRSFHLQTSRQAQGILEVAEGSAAV